MNTKKQDIKQYTGREIINRLDSNLKRQAYDCNWRQMKLNYGENVDFQLRYDQVMLCDKTKDYLYNDYTPLNTKYKKGTRPVLEKYTSKITKGCKSEGEKMLAIMRFCRDLYKKYDKEQLFYGGTEEELIKKGEQLCECLGRLMVALCEVEGIPGRVVMHVIGGHIVSELYVDGKWAYVDPRCGVYCLHPDGSFASIWEVWNNPDLIKSQPDKVKADVSANWTWEERLYKNVNKYFNPEEVNVLINYSLEDKHKYNYDWLSVKVAKEQQFIDIHNRYVELSDKIFNL